jgi:hypothetical protein
MEYENDADQERAGEAVVQTSEEKKRKNSKKILKSP